MKRQTTLWLTLFGVGPWALFAQPQSGPPLWVYDTGAYNLIGGSPAVGADGTLYICAGPNLYAITNAGSIASNKWIVPYGGSSPAIGADGTIYTAAGNLYGVRPDGSLRWSYPSVGDQGPALSGDNTLYIQATSYLQAVVPNGTFRWSGPGGGGSYFSSPVIGSDGSVYIASAPIYTFYALRPDGTERWHAEFGVVGTMSARSPAIGRDGTIYICAGNGLNAFSANGTPLWTNTAAQSYGVAPSSP